MTEARILAERQARDIDRIDDLDGKFVRLVYSNLKDAAREGRHKVEINDKILDAYTDLLARAYLKRYQTHTRRKRQARVDLALPSLRKIALQFDLDVSALKKRLRPLAKKSIKAHLGKIESTLQSAIAETTGQPIKKAMRSITKRLHRLGVSPINDSYLSTLVKTNASIAYNAAEAVRFEGDIDLWGYQYVTVGDDRVRPSHEALDGIKRRKDDAFWDSFWPPNGYNCRCQVIPIYGNDRSSRVPDVKPDEGFDFNPKTLIGV